MNVPSYNALFTSRDRTVKTIMELCEKANKGGGGGSSSDIFIYELYSDVNISTPGTYPIQDAELAPAIHEAVSAGKQVYISFTNDHLSHTIFPLASTINSSGMEGYSFIITTLGGSHPMYSVVNLTISVMYSEQQNQSFLTVAMTKSHEVKIVNHGTSRTTYTLPANECHIWGTVADLNITLAAPENSSVVNEYWFIFTSGSTPTNLTLPEGLLWDTNIDTTSQFIEANTTYEFHICNNIVRMGGAR